jgi:hypothetical protein
MIYPPFRRDKNFPHPNPLPNRERELRLKKSPLLKVQEEAYVYTVLSSSRYE